MSRLLLNSFIAVLLGACGGGGGGGGLNGRQPDMNPGLPEMVSVAPEATGDGWSVSTPAAEGLVAGQLQSTLESIRDGSYPGVDAMLVIRHGKLVAEG